MQDIDFINGLEAGVGIVKRIFELSVDERRRVFGVADVAKILSHFDFAQLNELIKTVHEPQLRHYHIIRGIKVVEGHKKCVVESERYLFYPPNEIIDGFLKLHTLPIPDSKQIDFAVVEEIWVLE